MRPLISGEELIWVIESPAELAELAAVHERYARYRGLVIIAQNIDMSGMPYVPPGRLDLPFNWTIDGGMNTISNLNCMIYHRHFGGLVGYGSFTVRNLVISNIQIEARSYVGAVAGFLQDGKIENVMIKDINLSGRLFTGGLLGGCMGATLRGIRLDLAGSRVHSTGEKAALIVSQLGPRSSVSEIEIVTSGLQSVKLFSNVLNRFGQPSVRNIVIRNLTV